MKYPAFYKAITRKFGAKRGPYSVGMVRRVGGIPPDSYRQHRAGKESTRKGRAAVSQFRRVLGKVWTQRVNQRPIVRGQPRAIPDVYARISYSLIPVSISLIWCRGFPVPRGREFCSNVLKSSRDFAPSTRTGGSILRITLYYPCRSGKPFQRRVRTRLRAPPSSKSRHYESSRVAPSKIPP